MSSGQSDPPARRPLRLWPGVGVAMLMCLAWLGLRLFEPGFMRAFVSVVGGLSGALLIFVWWAFISTAYVDHSAPDS